MVPECLFVGLSVVELCGANQNARIKTRSALSEVTCLTFYLI